MKYLKIVKETKIEKGNDESVNYAVLQEKLADLSLKIDEIILNSKHDNNSNLDVQMNEDDDINTIIKGDEEKDGSN